MWKEHSKVIATVKRVMPAVVSIIISKPADAVERELPAIDRRGHKNKNGFHIPPDKIDAHGMVQVGGGSGFIVDSSGIVLTNKHVIAESGAAYTVITNADEHLAAEVLARDPVNDVAILRVVSLHHLPEVRLGDSTHLELGQTVLAIGNALGIFKNTVSLGIISGLSRSVSAQADPEAPPQELRGLIQTDAAINPGNSGGPLVDIFGRAIGINAAVVSGAQNINFAIPIKAALRDLEDLKKYGNIRRPLLGLRYLTVTEDYSQKMGFPTAFGAFITKEHPSDEAVAVGSPAALADIREGDILTHWNGRPITEERSIQDYLDDARVGELVSFTVVREGKELTCMVKLAERK
ncbi:MAG: trypsin-like peptidase domain-containing protein [bacterium]|nr:trypsin-like peptidase domain-containing protein [bacterium]